MPLDEFERNMNSKSNKLVSSKGKRTKMLGKVQTWLAENEEKGELVKPCPLLSPLKNELRELTRRSAYAARGDVLNVVWRCAAYLNVSKRHKVLQYREW